MLVGPPFHDLDHDRTMGVGIGIRRVPFATDMDWTTQRSPRSRLGSVFDRNVLVRIRDFVDADVSA